VTNCGQNKQRATKSTRTNGWGGLKIYGKGIFMVELKTIELFKKLLVLYSQVGFEKLDV